MNVHFRRVMVWSLALVGGLVAMLFATARAETPQVVPGRPRTQRVQGQRGFSGRFKRGRPHLATWVPSPTPEGLAPAGDELAPTGNEPGVVGSVEGSWGECSGGNCNNSCVSCGPATCSSRGMWVGGAEYLYVRPTFSEGIAFVQSAFDGPDLLQTRQPFDMNYKSSVRAFLGYRFCRCGGELMFTYTNLRGDANAQTGTATGSTVYTGQLEINTASGERLRSATNVDVDTYDVDFSKRVFSSRRQADEGCCPRWDVFWSAGVRIADIDLDYASVILDGQDASTARGRSDISLTGAGPRLGMLGRRYLGPAGKWALFAKGNISLLLSDYDVTSRRFVSSPQTSHQVERASLTRVVPVTEIEVGGTCRVTPHGTLAVGYLFHTWYDMGITQSIGGNLPTYDTANTLSFDGLFARAEWVY